MSGGHSPGREPSPDEGLQDLMGEYRERLGSLFPPEFRQHVRAARREFWLAVRSLVDARLEALEGEASPPPPPGRGRINVE